MFRWSGFLWPSLLLVSGCHGRGAISADAATDITNTYMMENDSIDYNDMAIETVDMGDRWRISYSYPEGGTGGPMIFVVDKRSGRIIRMESEQ